MSESTNSNNDDKPNNANENQPTYYERRKNLISGVDNSHLAIGIASFGALAGFTALLFPEQIQRLKENVVSLFQKKPAELPAPPAVQPEYQYQEEPYIPPTPQQNHQVIPQQQTVEEPVHEEKQQEEEQEPEIFYDDELAKREKRLFGKNRRIDKYDSPFGAGIANS